MTIDEAKKNARIAAAAIRKRAAANHPNAGDRLCDQIVGHASELGLQSSRIISAFLPIGSEIDTLSTFRFLHENGHTTALPVVTGKAQSLIFRKWSPGEELVSGAFGTSEPLPDVSEVIPDIMLVPLLAFDAAGYRLGYGGGFYDRTIEKLEHKGGVITLGVAFSAQQVDTVPRGPHDKPLQWIATEAQFIKTNI